MQGVYVSIVQGIYVSIVLGVYVSIVQGMYVSIVQGIVAVPITLAPIMSVDIDVLRQDGPQPRDQGGSHELVPPTTWGMARTPGLLR